MQQSWADPRAIEQMGEAFARLDVADCWRALMARIGLFQWLALETAQQLGYARPGSVAQEVADWVLRLRGVSTMAKDGSGR